MTAGYSTLTDKEKQTLRLLVDGHDAKSIARTLGLSVHTINERLRDARRKMAVSSSREAARLLREVEGRTPEILGDKGFGDASTDRNTDRPANQAIGVGRSRRRSRITGGIAMTFPLALLAFASLSGDASAPAAAPPAATLAQSAPVTAATHWLALVDRGDWSGAWSEAGQTFKELNTVEQWASAAKGVLADYGTTSGRTLISSEWTPAPPNGVQSVKFRTMTSKKGPIIETLALSKEGGSWKVVGIVID
jgi:DNA-binding CsgD family transcriptional regulator